MGIGRWVPLGTFRVRDGCEVEAGNHPGEGVGLRPPAPGPSLRAAPLSSGAACS